MTDTDALGEKSMRALRWHMSPEEKFWSYVDKTPGCWNWTGALDPGGYGTIHIGKKKTRAHRYAWELVNEPIPPGMLVDHVCHNPACVKTDHLRLASTQENSYNRSGPARNNKLGIRNVYPHSGGGFAVQVRKQGQAYGSWHRDLESAVREAEMLRERLFGEFAGAGSRTTESGGSDEHR